MNLLTLPMALPIQAHNAGLFVSRGSGKHPDRSLASYELIVVRSGMLRIQEADVDFQVGPGESLLLFPGRRHFGTMPYGSDLTFYWFHFAYTAAPAVLGESSVSVPQHGTGSEDELMTLSRRSLDIQADTGELSTYRRSLLLLEMLSVITASVGRVSAVSPVNAGVRLADSANALIRVRFAEKDLSTQVIADALGVNPDYLGRVFRSTYGKPLMTALHEHRLRYARTLLLDDSKNIEEIARAAGYGNGAFFRRVFKREIAVSPQVFRRLHSRQYVNTE